MITIGIDNGTSGTIGVLGGDEPEFHLVPHQEHLHYSAKGKFIKRIIFDELSGIFGRHWQRTHKAYIERPLTGGPAMVNQMLLAARAYEATLIALEEHQIGYETIDSKAWQKALLPGVKGSKNLKKASMFKGIELYPQFEEAIRKHKDADGLLIAHHYHNLQ